MNFIYERKVNYYETDKMGVVHHSNYIRYMEEARCTWMEDFGLPFSVLEENGITIPVLSVNCNYKYHATFGDTIIIRTFAKEYTGVKMIIGYEITDKKGEKVFLTGETKHCFTSKELKPINLKKSYPEFHEKFQSLLEEPES